jgi:hypothetical protein
MPAKVTADSIDIVEKIFDTDDHSFEKNINLIKDVESLLEIINLIQANLSGTSEDPNIQYKTMVED